MSKNYTFSDILKYRPLKTYQGLYGKIPVVGGETFIGVELEIENVREANPPNTFKIEQDGSLRNNGVEFITIPIKFKYLEVELQRLFKSINENKEYSSRCSVHIHMNARDFTLEELQVFILTYMVFEKLLYHYSGNRWNNLFCVPLNAYITPVIQLLNMQKIEDYRDVIWFKYFGINLSTLWAGVTEHESRNCLGTIEFRHMKGTDNIEYIINWINFITSLKLFAKKTSLGSFKNKLLEMNSDSSYYILADDIFGKLLLLLKDIPAEKTKEYLESCISKAKLCLPS